MEDQNIEKLELLKAKVHTTTLENVLRPHFSKLVSKTTNTHRLVMALFEEGALSPSEMDQCLNEPVGFYRNLEVYNLVMKKNVGDLLINALHYSGNDHIFQLLQTDFSQSAVAASHFESDKSSNSKASCLCSPVKDSDEVDQGSTVSTSLEAEFKPPATPTSKLKSIRVSYLTKSGVENRTDSNKLPLSDDLTLLQTIPSAKSAATGQQLIQCTCGSPRSCFCELLRFAAPSIEKMIKIPETKEEVQKALQNNPSHTGLTAAVSSITSGRHPHTANILFLGTTGSGKSSTINSLLGGPVADQGNQGTVSKAIVEYRITFPLNDLGISNAALNLIDTPGFGGLADDRRSDARIQASIQNYLDTEQNHGYALTALVVTSRFDDTRFAGENGAFVYTLKVIEGLRRSRRALDRATPIFVFTHLMNATKTDRQDPKSRVEKFSRVIQQYTGIKNPVILLAENRAEDWELEKNESNGFYNLPNGEFFPFNIYKGIYDAIEGQTGDPVGQAILVSVYENILCYRKPKKATLDLTDGRSSQRTKSTLMGDQGVKAGGGNIKDLLEKWAKSNLDKSGLTEHDLAAVLRPFNKRKIEETNQYPKNLQEIVQIVKELPNKSELISILAEAIGFEIPALTGSPLTGQSFDILSDSVLSTSPLQKVCDLSITSLGLSISSDFKLKSKGVQYFDFCEFYPSHKDYIKKRMDSFGVNAEDWPLKIYPVLKGHNIQTEGSYDFTAVREVAVFTLFLKNRYTPPLNPEFLQALENLPLNASDYPAGDNLKKFRQFFRKYGTHVVTSSCGGGLMVLEAKYGQANVPGKEEFAPERIKTAVALAFLKLFDSKGIFSSLSFEPFESLVKNFDLTVTLHGGNSPKGGRRSFKLLTIGNRACLELEKWQESLLENPVMLRNKIHLKPISHFAGQHGQKLDLALKYIYLVAKDEVEDPKIYKPLSPPNLPRQIANKAPVKNRKPSAPLGIRFLKPPPRSPLPPVRFPVGAVPPPPPLPPKGGISRPLPLSMPPKSEINAPPPPPVYSGCSSPKFTLAPKPQRLVTNRSTTLTANCLDLKHRPKRNLTADSRLDLLNAIRGGVTLKKKESIQVDKKRAEVEANPSVQILVQRKVMAENDADSKSDEESGFSAFVEIDQKKAGVEANPLFRILARRLVVAWLDSRSDLNEESGTASFLERDKKKAGGEAHPLTEIMTARRMMLAASVSKSDSDD